VVWAEAYLHTKWHLDALQPFGHNKHGPKIERAPLPILGKGAG